MAYQLINITYNIENEAKTPNIPNTHYLYPLKEAIENYEKALETLENSLSDGSTATLKQIQDARDNVTDTYNTYILALVEAQKEEGRRKGDIV